MTRDVLIADDTEDMRLLMRVLLTESRYTVVGEATDGDEALSMWGEHRGRPLAAVILDQRMPGRTGLEVARQILDDQPDQTVLICSAFVDEELQSATDDLGIQLVPKGDLFTLTEHLEADDRAPDR